MPRCAGFKPSGEQCERIVGAPHIYCFAHDPSRSQERTRNASKAGKSRPSSEIRSVKNQLQDLTNRLLSGEVDRADAAVCGQLLNVKLRALEQERRWREIEELEARLEAVEGVLKGREKRTSA